jgi:hypothetical protein
MGLSRGAEDVRILDMLPRREPLCSSSVIWAPEADVRRLVDRMALRGRVCDDSAEPLEEVELCRCRAGLPSIDCCGVSELVFMKSILRDSCDVIYDERRGEEREVFQDGAGCVLRRLKANFFLAPTLT